jgi:hypothetical protein
MADPTKKGLKFWRKKSRVYAMSTNQVWRLLWYERQQGVKVVQLVAEESRGRYDGPEKFGIDP